jgi:hypothetical protein
MSCVSRAVDFNSVNARFDQVLLEAITQLARFLVELFLVAQELQNARPYIPESRAVTGVAVDMCSDQNATRSVDDIGKLTDISHPQLFIAGSPLRSDEVLAQEDAVHLSQRTTFREHYQEVNPHSVEGRLQTNRHLHAGQHDASRQIPTHLAGETSLHVVGHRN